MQTNETASSSRLDRGIYIDKALEKEPRHISTDMYVYEATRREAAL